jgi:hypothetical protein
VDGIFILRSNGKHRQIKDSAPLALNAELPSQERLSALSVLTVKLSYTAEAINE